MAERGLSHGRSLGLVWLRLNPGPRCKDATAESAGNVLCKDRYLFFCAKTDPTKKLSVQAALPVVMLWMAPPASSVSGACYDLQGAKACALARDQIHRMCVSDIRYVAVPMCLKQGLQAYLLWLGSWVEFSSPEGAFPLLLAPHKKAWMGGGGNRGK